jgi:hypothetical protein
MSTFNTIITSSLSELRTADQVEEFGAANGLSDNAQVQRRLAEIRSLNKVCRILMEIRWAPILYSVVKYLFSL